MSWASRFCALVAASLGLWAGGSKAGAQPAEVEIGVAAPVWGDARGLGEIAAPMVRGRFHVAGGDWRALTDGGLRGRTRLGFDLILVPGLGLRSAADELWLDADLLAAGLGLELELAHGLWRRGTVSTELVLGLGALLRSRVADETVQAELEVPDASRRPLTASRGGLMASVAGASLAFTVPIGRKDLRIAPGVLFAISTSEVDIDGLPTAFDPAPTRAYALAATLAFSLSEDQTFIPPATGAGRDATTPGLYLARPAVWRTRPCAGWDCDHSTLSVATRSELSATAREAHDLPTFYNIMQLMRTRVQDRSALRTRDTRTQLAERTAQEILDSGWRDGCIDTATVTAGMLRAVDIPVIFVHGVDAAWAVTNHSAARAGDLRHFRGHTFLEVRLAERWYLIDPTAGQFFDSYDSANPNLPSGYVVQFKGGDMHDFGLKHRGALNESIRHFVVTHIDQLSRYTPPDYPRIKLSEPYEGFVRPLAAQPPTRAKLGHSAPVLRAGVLNEPAKLELSAGNLPPVRTGHYELWARIFGNLERVASFNTWGGQITEAVGTTARSVIPVGPHARSATWAGIALAPTGQPARPRAFVVAGPVSNGIARLVISDPDALGISLTGRQLGISKLTATGSDPQKPHGVWWCMADETGVVPSAPLPPLPESWVYEHWISIGLDGRYHEASLGRFRRPDAFDTDGAGPQAGPGAPSLCRAPGQDFVGGASEIPGPVPLDRAEVRVSLTVEPADDPEPSDPFVVQIAFVDLTGVPSRRVTIVDEELPWAALKIR